MSIQSEITRIQNNVRDVLDLLEAEGVVVGADANSDDLAALLEELIYSHIDCGQLGESYIPAVMDCGTFGAAATESALDCGTF